MKVIIATDGSKYIHDCISFLEMLPQAKQWQYRVISVQVNILIDMHDEMTHSMWMESELQRAQIALASGLEVMKKAGFTAEGSIETGHAGDAIVAAASEFSADLCILGARGHSALDRILLGSTSDFVATHAHCSVLVVRPAENHLETDDIKILVPFDDSDASKNTIRLLGSGFAPPKAKIELLHIIERPILLDQSIPYAADWREKALTRMESEKQKLGSPLAEHATAQVREASHVAESICNYAAETNTILIAMGERGRSAIGRMLLGSNSRYVLRHAQSSVLLVR